MFLSSTHHLVCQDHVQFLPFTVGVLPEIVLPCSSFLTECFQLRHLRCMLLSNGLTFSRFFGLTRLSKKQLSFTSSSSSSFFSPVPF